MLPMGKKTECRDCRHSGGQHDPACPENPVFLPWKKFAARRAYNAGWVAGRNRRDLLDVGGPPEWHASFTLGYIHGDAAADEAENGSSW